MTLEDAAQDVWEALGEPTDLEFRNVTTGDVDVTTAGWGKLRRGIERGMIATMQAKVGRDQRHVRWAGGTKTTSLLGGSTETVTVVSALETSLTVAEANPRDYYLGWMVDDGTTLRRVAWSSGTLIVLAEAFTSNPAVGTVLTLRAPFLAVEPGTVVLRVTDTTNGNDLVMRRPEDVVWESSPTVADPVAYVHAHGRVYLDPPPEGSRYFLVEQEAYPTLENVTPSASLPVPEPLQYAVVLWATAWGFGRYLNPKMKSALRSEWRETLIETQLPEDNVLDRQDESFGVRRA